MYPAWLGDVVTAGFQDVETFSFDLPRTRPGRGRIRASAGVAASLTPEEVACFDADLRTLLAERFREEALQVLHRVFAVVCHNPDR